MKDPNFWKGTKFVCMNHDYPVLATVTLMNEENHLTEFHEFSHEENNHEDAGLDRAHKKIPALADASF
jgi:hypothetical protein